MLARAMSSRASCRTRTYELHPCPPIRDLGNLQTWALQHWEIHEDEYGERPRIAADLTNHSNRNNIATGKRSWNIAGADLLRSELSIYEYYYSTTII